MEAGQQDQHWQQQQQQCSAGHVIPKQAVD
jgi:hypothetical protein